MNKIIFSLFILTLSSVALVAAEEQSLGSVQQGKCIVLKQICSNCTYNNITSVVYPNKNQAIGQVAMTKIGTEYNYTFCDTGFIGQYLVNGKGDLDGETETWVYDFEVTASGLTGLLGLHIILIGAVYAVTLIGFFGRNEYITIFGGLAMIPLGLYTLNNGIDIFRNFMTEAFSIVTTGLGAFLSLYSTVAIIENNM